MSSLAACQHGGRALPSELDRGWRDASVIGREQLGSHPDLPSAYLLVEALHGNWLRERRAESPGVSGTRTSPLPAGWRAPAGQNAGVQVYLNGHRLGGVELLRNIPTVTLLSIRHLTANEAQSRYGAGHSHGAILVQTLSQRR